MNLNKIKIILVFTAFTALFFACAAFAQESGEGVYYKKYGYDFALRPYFGWNFASLGYDNKKTDESMIYMPNTPFTLGLGVTIGRLSVSAGYGADIFKEEDNVDTEALDLQTNYYGRNLLIGGFWQQYDGFYTKGSRTYERKDIKLHRAAVFWEYVLNPEKFSYRASFSAREKQLKSAGSFLAGGGVYYNKVEADYAFDDKKSLTPDPQKFEIWQFGPSVGYGYTWVPKEHYVLTGSMMLGVNATVSTINDDKVEVMVFPSISPKIAAGYNKDSWGVNLSVILNISYVAEVGDDQLTFRTGKVILSYIRRFSLKAEA